jgi:hypothetical protein
MMAHPTRFERVAFAFGARPVTELYCFSSCDRAC